LRRYGKQIVSSAPIEPEPAISHRDLRRSNASMLRGGIARGPHRGHLGGGAAGILCMRRPPRGSRRRPSRSTPRPSACVLPARLSFGGNNQPNQRSRRRRSRKQTSARLMPMSRDSTLTGHRRSHSGNDAA
jgi:hypothetical protein